MMPLISVQGVVGSSAGSVVHVNALPRPAPRLLALNGLSGTRCVVDRVADGSLDGLLVISPASDMAGESLSVSSVAVPVIPPAFEATTETESLSVRTTVANA